MAKRIRKVVFITGYRPGGPYYWAEKLVKKIGELDCGYRATHPKTLFQTVWAMLFAQADVIHSTVPIPFRVWPDPIVMTIKGDFWREKGPLWQYYPRAIVKASAVTVPSQFIKRLLNIDQANVIPNGFDLPEVSPRSELSDAQPVHLLTVTKFHFKDKASGILNLHQILEAAVKGIDREVVWDILGDGSFRNEIESQVKSSKLKINFRGFVDPKSFYQQANIFLYYSDHDNMPNAVIEAMGYGLPVITNDVGAVGEVVVDGQTGYVCATETEYQTKLLELLKDPAHSAELGRQGREIIATRFSNDVIAKKYIELYEKILAK